jgi:exosortase H (IPTLxxWG-CTERM-specific)
MGRFVFWFVVLLLGSFIFYLLPWGQQYVSTPITSMVAALSAFFMKIFDSGIVSEGIRIYDKEGGPILEVIAGCNGMEAVIILLAAVFAFPATVVQKLIGFVSGFVAIHALNVVRIISLYYIAIWDMKWYEWFHLYVWQMLIILDALLVWLLWLRWINKSKRSATEKPGTAKPAVA